MAFSYNKLWKILIDKGMNKVALRDSIKMSPNTLARLSKNKPVQMVILGRICQEFDCNVGDIVDYIDDSNEDEPVAVNEMK